MPNIAYSSMTEEEIDAVSQALQQEMEASRLKYREELLAIQRVRDERAKTSRVDRMVAGLSPTEREAFLAKIAARPPTQSIGVGDIPSGEHVPGIG